MLIVPQKNFVFVNKEVSTFKKRWMFLQILFNTLVQLQIKEKIQEDKGPLMELSTCQQNFTLGKKKNTANQTTTTTKPLFNMCNPISTTVRVSIC